MPDITFGIQLHDMLVAFTFTTNDNISYDTHSNNDQALTSIVIRVSMKSYYGDNHIHYQW